jgi:hypothetical protein
MKSKKVVQSMPKLVTKKQLGFQPNPTLKNTLGLGVIHAQTLA